MDGFTDNFVPVDNAGDVDPAAEFLAREQNELAGLDDDIAIAPAINMPDELNGPSPPPDDPVPVEETNGPVCDLATSGLENEQYDYTPPPEISSDYAVDQPDYTFNEDAADIDFDAERRMAATPSPIPSRDEPEKIRLWREKQKERLEEKDKAEEVEKEELREKAKKELEEWYKQHEEQVTKTRQANRSAEKELVADTSKMEPGTEWERIAKLCDFNPKTAKSSRDISRMRTIILKVKQNPPVKA